MQRKSSAAFLHQVERTVTRHNMLTTGDRVLVAVSGGPDSVALLGGLAALSKSFRIELGVAHFNHQLRGAESDRDQRNSEMVAERLGVRCVVGRGRELSGAANLEARARAARYAFLAQVADTQGWTKIATGHTLDDQAETVLMRLLRGTGYDGLAGVRAVRGRIVRPIIECSRSQVLAFLDRTGLPWCQDSSNDDRHFLRNRIRHEVVPLLQSINPAVGRTLASIAEIAGGEVQALDDQVVRALAAASSAGDGGLPVAALTPIPPALRGRMVRAWLARQRGDLSRLGATHVRAVLGLAMGRRPNARVRLPGGQAVVREYERLVFDVDTPEPVVEPVHWLADAAVLELGSGWRIAAEVSPLDDGQWQRPSDLWSAVADADDVALPVMVRSPRLGDRIRPLGLGGSRKLQDVFVDRKVPLDRRRTCPVVESRGEILWVPGVARGQGGLVSGKTRQILRLAAEIGAKSAVAGR